MIKAIREIGEYALKRSGKSVENPLEILVDNPANRQTKNILFIKFKSEGENLVYDGIEIEEFDAQKLPLYLYRKGSARGTDITPTAMITKPVNTFRQKILAWFKNYKDEQSNELFFKLAQALNENTEDIESEIESNYSAESNIFSLKIDGKYLGEFDEFRQILLDNAKTDYYYKSSFTTGKKSIAENQLCSVCNKNKAEVYGFVSTFKFYTVDKPGFVSGGFRQSDAWKNYPVCLECALVLEEGKKFLGEKFNFNFYGTKYLLIPKFLTDIDEEDKKEVFKIFEEQDDPKIRERVLKRLTNDEKEILYLTGELKNYLNLNFLFYNAPKGFNGAVFNVLQIIEDVLPSRIRKIFDVKREIDSIELFSNHLVPVFEGNKKIGEKTLEFNFGVLRTFFYNSAERNPISDKYFLETVNKIFSSRQIDYDFILGFIVDKIRNDFANDYSTLTDTLKGFMLLAFLTKLNLIKLSKGDNKMGENFFTSNGEISEKIEAFFERFPEFFNSAEKKAVFLEGALAQFLLNIQYRDKNSQPFRARLKGLKMDKALIIKLLPEIQNKLEEYGKNYYRELETKISEYFVLAGDKWNLSNDEISFYFALGMNLSKYFKSNKEEGEENGND